jgi:hypothetical protein
MYQPGKEANTMAVQSTVVKSALSLKYKEGVDQTGKDIIKAKKFSNVKTDAEDSKIYSVANALSPLMKYPVLDIVRSDENILINL